jgi:multidrug transporter EmrE-like cation transporter
MNTKSKKGIKLSGVLACLTMLLAGFAVGINVGSQFFTERPDFISSILLGIVLLGCIIIPYVRKKEKEKQ